MKSKTRKGILILIIAVLITGNSYLLVRNILIIEDYNNANLILPSSPFPTTNPLWTFTTGFNYVNEVAISSNGKYVSILSHKSFEGIDDKIYLFDNTFSTKKTPLWNYSISETFSSLVLSANGSFIVVGGGTDDKSVYLFNNSVSMPIWTNQTDDYIYSVAISDDGKYIAAASVSKIYFFNNMSPIPIWEASMSGVILIVAISSDGSYIAATDNAGMLYFFDKASNIPVWNYSMSSGMATSLSISKDGFYIVMGGDESREMYVFNRLSSNPLWTFQFDGAIRSIKISPDGNYIVVVYFGRDVYLFNFFIPFPICTYLTESTLSKVDVSFNGEYIVAQSSDGFVYLFNKRSSLPIWKYKLDHDSHIGSPSSLDISSDGKYIIAGGSYNVYLFDRDIIIDRSYHIISESIILIITGIVSFISIIIFIKKIRTKRK